MGWAFSNRWKLCYSVKTSGIWPPQSLVHRNLEFAASCWSSWERTARKDQELGKLAGATQCWADCGLPQVTEYGRSLMVRFKDSFDIGETREMLYLHPV
jgi:hypothetical protein